MEESADEKINEVSEAPEPKGSNKSLFITIGIVIAFVLALFLMRSKSSSKVDIATPEPVSTIETTTDADVK